MTIVSLHHTSPCHHCLVSHLCESSKQQFGIDTSARSHRVYNRRENLFSAGQTFQGIYALRSGSAKSFVSVDEGQEQVTGFHFPGEIIGVDGLGSEQYLRSVEFLETSSVCFFSAAELRRLLHDSEQTRERIFRAMNKLIGSEHSLLFRLNHDRSEQRLARFLLELSDKYSQRGLSARRFDLSMTRTDIANYLGMAIETISRLLTRFQQSGAIDVKNRQVDILSSDILRGFLAPDAAQTREVTRTRRTA